MSEERYKLKEQIKELVQYAEALQEDLRQIRQTAEAGEDYPDRLGSIAIICYSSQNDPIPVLMETAYAWDNCVQEMQDQIAELEAEAEKLRMQLVACGVAALGNTPKSASERIGKENPYFSASYLDVCNAVDREMSFRTQLSVSAEQIRALREALTDAVSNLDRIQKELDLCREWYPYQTARPSIGIRSKEQMQAALSLPPAHYARVAEAKEKVVDEAKVVARVYAEIVPTLISALAELARVEGEK